MASHSHVLVYHGPLLRHLLVVSRRAHASAGPQPRGHLHRHESPFGVNSRRGRVAPFFWWPKNPGAKQGPGYLGFVDSNQGYNLYKWVICSLTTIIHLHMGGFLKIDNFTPKWMVTIMENLFWKGWFGWKTDHFRKPPFGREWLEIYFFGGIIIFVKVYLKCGEIICRKRQQHSFLHAWEEDSYICTYIWETIGLLKNCFHVSMQRYVWYYIFLIDHRFGTFIWEFLVEIALANIYDLHCKATEFVRTCVW